MKSDIQTVIMRRVYYSYGLSIVSDGMFWQGIFLPVAAYFLAKWLHVASIVNNFLSLPVGSAPQYVVNSFLTAATQGELVMVVTLIVTGVVALSVGYQLAQALTHQFLLHRAA